MKYRLKKIFFSNWLVATFLTLIIISGMLLEFYPLQFLEFKTFDFLAGLRREGDATPIVIVAIDEKSIQDIGPWPWPRSYIAEVVNRLSVSRPRVMGIHLLFTGKELNPGLSEVQGIRETLRTDAFLKKRKSRYKLDKILAEAEETLDNDARLTAAVNYAVNTVLPVRFTAGDSSRVNPEPPLPVWLSRNSLALEAVRPRSLIQSRASLVYTGFISTYEELARRAAALGHTNIVVDPDGTVRSEQVFIEYRQRRFPSLALQMATRYLGGDLRDVLSIDAGLNIKGRDVPTDHHGRMMIDFGGGVDIRRVSFSDVYHQGASPELFTDKIVLIGNTVPWLTQTYRASVSGEMTGVEVTARSIGSMLSRTHISRPPWVPGLEILVVVYFGLFLVFLMPRLKPREGALILSIFLVTWISAAVVLLMVYGYWLHMLAPVLLAASGFTFAGISRFAGEKEKESTELNKMLGLSLQGKGMLEMAFEKYANCPVSDASVRELLYNLGQDFERKRMFNRAVAVYAHMLKAGKYADIHARIERLKNLAEMPSPAATRQNGSIILDSRTTKPTLGRYEILKELGRGAMGTVYLGRDPKINREVAIKTLSYASVDAESLEEVKERFLQEAEAAGNLAHPNIVTIYDVGEERDMAYMAMELLTGHQLTENCRENNLLPVKRVLELVSAVAEALQYAHSNGVVHRDIKPDNIILLENGKVKVADFGIARVISASRTQTGVILGTPSYMSPEQAEGLRVDGRSDLFSLGVVFYELLSGKKPFTGDSIANLMYAIANASYVPLPKVAPDVPECCKKIVKKMLNKKPEKRAKSADDVVKSIRRCLESLG